MTAVTFPLRPPPLAFAICGWRWQNDLHEIKYKVIKKKKKKKKLLSKVRFMRKSCKKLIWVIKMRFSGSKKY